VTVQQQDAIEAVRQAAAEASVAGQLPAFLAAVEQVRIEAVLAAAGPREAPATPKDARTCSDRPTGRCTPGAQQVVGLPAQDHSSGHAVPDRRLRVR
jgi:hypothetical protein